MGCWHMAEEGLYDATCQDCLWENEANPDDPTGECIVCHRVTDYLQSGYCSSRCYYSEN